MMNKEIDHVHRPAIGCGLFPAMHGDAVVRVGEVDRVTSIWGEGVAPRQLAFYPMTHMFFWDQSLGGGCARGARVIGNKGDASASFLGTYSSLQPHHPISITD